uniref:Putative DNA primase n=1 Tax=viral metagenome TaxID=1070528 RepID=A0A6M3M2J5_9ZZZZ
MERGWWQEREIVKPDPKPKYLSTHAPIGDRLYNWQTLSRKEVYITEGIISAACLGDRAIALCSKQATPEQFRRLSLASTERYTVCLDADAQTEAMELAKSLSSFGKEVVIRIYSEGDPASCQVYQDVEFSWKNSIEMRLR